VNKFYLFSKKSCGPCALVDKYFKGVKDERISIIEKVDLEDAGDEPIPERNLRLAKFYSVTATPVLVITDEEGRPLDTKVGGLAITQNIRTLLETYAS
jgi:thioredoxin-related protein